MIYETNCRIHACYKPNLVKCLLRKMFCESGRFYRCFAGTDVTPHGHFVCTSFMEHEKEKLRVSLLNETFIFLALCTVTGARARIVKDITPSASFEKVSFSKPCIFLENYGCLQTLDTSLEDSIYQIIAT